jgi:enoyl-CoA hydratase/carnithine racemase
MTVLTETTDRIRIISINRPDRHNALNDPTLALLSTAISDAAGDPAVDVILLRGEGASFSSGLDTATLDSDATSDPSSGTTPKSDDYTYIRAHQDRRLIQLDFATPIVSALKGYVIGGGMEVALATDIRIAATDVRMSLPEARYGITTDTGGSVFTTILAGPSRAKLLLLTGRKIDGKTAYEWGLVDLLVEPDELDEAAMKVCHEIARNSRTAVRVGKQLVDQTWDGAIRRGIRAELLAQTALFAGSDFTALAQKS